MATKISYCDETVNIITGCTKVSPGCKNCYAAAMAPRLKNRFGYGINPFEPTFHTDKLTKPSEWKTSKVIFLSSMGDMFHHDVPFAWLDLIFTMIKQENQHQYLLLTKRPRRMHEYIVDYLLRYGYLPNNIWLGVTAEDQQRANERLPVLFKIPAHHYFVSIEPMLEPINLECVPGISALNWAICGGETGQKARFMQPDWARSIRDQCNVMNVPFYMKQMSRKTPIPIDLFVKELPVGLR